MGALSMLGCGDGGRPDVYANSLDIQFERVDGGYRLPDGRIVYDDKPVPTGDLVRADATVNDLGSPDGASGDGGAGDSGAADPDARPNDLGGDLDAGMPLEDVFMAPEDHVDADMEDVERCTPGMTRFCAPSPGIPEMVYGRGICRRGNQSCSDAGRWNDCEGQIDPRPGGEECNNLDDNCDGIVDNLFRECGNGPCRVRRLVCVLGREVTCEPNTAARRTELCNGADDDCDGFVDENDMNTSNLQESCFTYPPEYNGRGICRSGTRTCVDAGWTPCDDTIPQPELCNGLDDDCDGVTDNACTDQ
ncbi:MAG: MopE-related protein [Polyangiales bacterium]